VNEVLRGDDEFVKTCAEWGFQRVQINATAINGVDTSLLAESIPSFLSVIQRHPELEFIIQRNLETQPLWQGLLDVSSSDDDTLPSNLSMLVDESKGTGHFSGSSWPSPPKNYDIGYAGGIGPDNIHQVLKEVGIAGQGRDVWIDMESSLRSFIYDSNTEDTKDIFDLGKCYQVIQAVCAFGLCSHPSYLPSGST
jgi:phosphoribosylanthranilate isomerase